MNPKKLGRPFAADREAIIADYRDGMYLRLIAAKHHVSTATVAQYAKDAGLTGRRANQGCRCKAGHVCSNCLPDIPLTGGRWVLDPVRRIQVWEAA